MVNNVLLSSRLLLVLVLFYILIMFKLYCNQPLINAMYNNTNSCSFISYIILWFQDILVWIQYKSETVKGVED